MLEVLEKQIKDVALPLNEKVIEELGLGRLGDQGLHNLIEVPT